MNQGWITMAAACIAIIPGVMSLLYAWKKTSGFQEVSAFNSIIKANRDLVRQFQIIAENAQKDLNASHQKHRDCESKHQQLEMQHNHLKSEFAEHQLECVLLKGRGNK